MGASDSAADVTPPARPAPSPYVTPPAATAPSFDEERLSERIVQQILDRWDGEKGVLVSRAGAQIIVSNDQGEFLYESERWSDIADYLQGWDDIFTEEALGTLPEKTDRINGACTANSVPPQPPRRRGRPPCPIVAERRRRVAELAEKFAPATCRQIEYQCEVLRIIPKTVSAMRCVERDLLLLRQQGIVDYDWISDNTRWMRKSSSYKGIGHFLDLTINTYRRDLWHSASSYVEIWLEKDALAGSLIEVTNPYDVPLMVARGFSSETYLYEAAQAIKRKGKPAYIYAFFDHDQSGKKSTAHIERKLRSFAPECEIHYELMAVTPQQITDWHLPTRETKRVSADGKRVNRHAKDFEGDSCELDSIPPDKLRDLVRNCIERHIDRDHLDNMRVAEDSERQALQMFGQNRRRS